MDNLKKQSASGVIPDLMTSISNCTGGKRTGILADNPLNFPAPCDCYDDVFIPLPGVGQAAYKLLPRSLKIQVLKKVGGAGLVAIIKRLGFSALNKVRYPKLLSKLDDAKRALSKATAKADDLLKPLLDLNDLFQQKRLRLQVLNNLLNGLNAKIKKIVKVTSSRVAI